MSKISSVCTLYEVEHEDHNGATFDGMQQESRNDIFTDFNMEVDEETMSAVEFTDIEADEDFLGKEDFSVGQDMKPSSIMVSNVVGGVNDGTSYFGAENENWSNKQLTSADNRSWDNDDVEYDPNMKVKMEDTSSDIETNRTTDIGHHYEPSENTQLPLYDIKQEPHYEDEVAGSPSSKTYGSQLSNYTHNQPSTLPAINPQSLSSHRVPHSMYVIRTSDSVAGGRSKASVPKLPRRVKSLVINSEDCCLVCNAPCIITENRKIPSLPFCKKCKKAYFYQLTHRYSKNIYINKRCTAEGTCRIDYRQSKICPRCHHVKFLAVLKAAQKAFKIPFKLKNPFQKGSKGPLDCQKRDWSSIRGEMLLQEALICQPVVLLTRLHLHAQGYSDITDNFNTIKEEPPNSTDSYMLNSLQPQDIIVAGKSGKFLITNELPDDSFHNLSHLNKSLNNSYKRQRIGPKCKLPKVPTLENKACSKKNVGKKTKRKPVSRKQLLTKKSGAGNTSSVEGACRSSSLVDASAASSLVGGASCTRAVVRSNKLKLVRTDLTEKQKVTLAKAARDSWSVVGTKTDNHNINDLDKMTNVSVSEYTTKSPVLCGLLGHTDVLKQPTAPLLNDKDLSIQNVKAFRKKVLRESVKLKRKVNNYVSSEIGICKKSSGKNKRTQKKIRKSVKIDMSVKSKFRGKLKNGALPVSVLTCGHACSQCNSKDTGRFLEDHHYSVNQPLAIAVNQAQIVFEFGASSELNAAIFQKLCEINQLLHGKSQCFFDHNTGTLKFKINKTEK